MARFTCNFISRILMRTVDMTVIIPSITIPESLALRGELEGIEDASLAPPAYIQYTGRPSYPVVYLLHGMGNNHTAWIAYTNVEVYAEERNIAVVMISAENKSYVNHGGSDNFFDFIQEELMDFVCGMFPVSQKPEDTFIAGLSMGGYGTLVHFLNKPERFAGAGVFSGAININPGALSHGKHTAPAPVFDPNALLENHRKAGHTLPPVYMACGEEDGLFADNIKYCEKLKAAGVQVTWAQDAGFGHEWRFWDKQVEKFFDWLPRTDPYFSNGERRI